MISVNTREVFDKNTTIITKKITWSKRKLYSNLTYNYFSEKL